MKKNNNDYIIVMGLFIIITVFTACSFGASRRGLPSLKTHAAFITVSIQEPFNPLTAIQNRSAVPSLPQDNSIEYEIQATCGEKIITQNQPILGNTIFRLEIEPGQWEVEVTGKKAETQTILFGQQTVIVDEYGNYDVTIPVYFIEAETGSLQLEIDVNETFIDKLVIGGTNTALDKEYFRDSEGIIHINEASIPAGTYSAVFSFYQNLGDDSSPNYALVISLQEKINVRKNLLTDSWKKSGDTIYLLEEQNAGGDRETKFVLTNEIITELVNSSFFISTADENQRKLNFSETIPADSNAGSWLDPFATLQAAINKIIAVDNNSSNSIPYTIYVDGPVDGDFNYENSLTSPIAIAIKPYINPTGQTSARLTGQAGNNQNNSTFTVGHNFSFTFTDITLDGIKLVTENNGKLIFVGNTKLENNYILLTENSKLYLENITSDPQNLNPVIAKIKCVNPEEGKSIIESNNEAELSAGIISRFRLQNPGYYLAYDTVTKKGVIKGSRLSIRLPKIGVCTSQITADTENDSLVQSNTNNFTIASNYFNDNDEIIFSAHVETPDYDSENNKIMISSSEIVMKLYAGAIPVISGNGNLSITKDSLLPGKYLLEASYEYDGLSYDSKSFIILR